MHRNELRFKRWNKIKIVLQILWESRPNEEITTSSCAIRYASSQSWYPMSWTALTPRLVWMDIKVWSFIRFIKKLACGNPETLSRMTCRLMKGEFPSIQHLAKSDIEYLRIYACFLLAIIVGFERNDSTSADGITTSPFFLLRRIHEFRELHTVKTCCCYPR